MGKFGKILVNFIISLFYIFMYQLIQLKGQFVINFILFFQVSNNFKFTFLYKEMFHFNFI